MSYVHPMASFFTPDTFRLGVKVGPDGNDRRSVCPVARILTEVPPTSTTSTFLAENVFATRVRVAFMLSPLSRTTNAPSFLRHGLLDRFDQLTGLKGLAQKGNATGLERLLAHGLVIEGGHEDDRKHGSATVEPPPQFNTRHPAEMDVQEETIDLSYCSTIEEFLRR